MEVKIEFSIPVREFGLLERLCQEKDLSELGIFRQALRIYQLDHIRAQEGYYPVFINSKGETWKDPLQLKMRLDNDTTSVQG